MEVYNPHLGYEADVIQNSMGMVHSVANKFRGATGTGLDYDDLVSVGTLGLIMAFRNFDGRVNAFSTYAYPWIKGMIQRFLQEKRYSVRVPRKIQERLRIVRKQGWTEEPAEAIAEKSGWRLEEVYELLNHLDGWSVASLDKPIPTAETELTMLDMLPEAEDFSGIDVNEFLSFLTDIERTVIELRMEGHTQLQIAQQINKSQVFVSRLIKRIQEKFTEFQAGTLTKEETAMRETVATAAAIEWFVDEKAMSNPTIGLNKTGIYLNRRAAHMLGCKIGQCVRVGFDGSKKRLIIQVGDNGIKLRKGNDSGGLALVNDRLVSWLEQKKIARKRYVLHRGTDVYYIELENHA
ncbi:sigma-70 family RNA polymerase sigma factor [Paenibacillus thiaminolyticus]|uniref:sigma-70 family RNA polymerase sigma factor n=1 Tax=Paenibacillus thiaminolyticus TaxID=49283 RepID=UPI002542E2EB|nr:sigma-70 family RNA polymerase sigma factor [Paenibacillus thiaminolyticus]WII39683.1 sigma-70 family RNA polymerase sigma factor [Paenibacillus thiaminolyticus]